MNICIEKVDAKKLLAELTLVMTSIPLARAFTCFLMFLMFNARFRIALIGGNLAALSRGSQRGLEAELKFQRGSWKLSFLFPPSTLESLLAGYDFLTYA